MIDSFGRNIHYLRLSLTDRCNLACKYCAPDSDMDSPPLEVLTQDEIKAILTSAAALGIDTLKLTGGEPLVRHDLIDIVRTAHTILPHITLTTNGVLLADKAKVLAESGVEGVSISLDTVDKDEYKAITQKDALDAVLAGIEAAVKYFSFVHINCVLRHDTTPESLLALAAYCRQRKVDLRFIEMMPIGMGRYQSLSNPDAVLKLLTDRYGTPQKTDYRGNGPAEYLQFNGFFGRIGFIKALHAPFCTSCNRIRVTADGRLKTCLYYQSSLNLRDIIRSHPEQLTQSMAEAILQKPQAHQFSFDTPIPKTAESAAMSRIGG